MMTRFLLFHQNSRHYLVRSLSLCWLVGPYKSSLEPDGSPLFPWNRLAACQRYEPRKSPRPLAMSRLGFLPSPVRDRVGDFEHDRFRGYLSVHWVPAYNLPVYASQCCNSHHARLGTRLRARRCRGRHCRRLDSTSFQGATLHGSGRAGLPHPALALGRDGEAHARIGMTDTWGGEPAGDVGTQTVPRQMVA